MEELEVKEEMGVEFQEAETGVKTEVIEMTEEAATAIVLLDQTCIIAYMVLNIPDKESW